MLLVYYSSIRVGKLYLYIYYMVGHKTQTFLDKFKGLKYTKHLFLVLNDIKLGISKSKILSEFQNI